MNGYGTESNKNKPLNKTKHNKMGLFQRMKGRN